MLDDVLDGSCSNDDVQSISGTSGPTETPSNAFWIKVRGCTLRSSGYTPYHTPNTSHLLAMFGYPFGYSGYSPSDEYAQALAEERAARAQYAAALRAQEEARKRAARARLAQQTYTSPYNSYLPDAMDDYDDDNFLTGHSFPSSYGLGASPQQRRAYLEGQRRRELMEREQERERQRLLEQRQREALEEERQLKLQEEEELQKRLLEEQQLREQQRGRRQRGLEQFYRDLGLRMPTFEQPEVSSLFAGHPFRACSDPSSSQPTPARRAHTASPLQREPVPPAKPPTPKQTPPPPTPSAEEVAAATKIQSFYRTHALHQKSLSELSSLSSRFDTLRSSFQAPSKVEFKGPNNEPVTVDVTLSLPVVTEEEIVDTRSLTYSSTNTPIHQYEEELNRLLTALDAVESGGDHKIRESRRELVRMVEKEAERLESWKVAVWRSGRTKPKQDTDVKLDVSGNTTSQTDGVVVPAELEIPSADAPSPNPSNTLEVAPESEATPLSVVTAEEPFFDAASTLEPEGSETEVEDAVLISPPSVSSPAPDDAESWEAKADIRKAGRFGSDLSLADPDWKVLDVFDLL